VRSALALIAVVTAAPAPQLLFHITDPRIDEASGIARGVASPGVVYVQNDSGDSARFFALDARTGETLATYTVPDATNVDWEDIAVARDRRGVPSVWLADIGDNDGRRPEIRVYRVDEPHVHAGGSAVTGAPEVWRLRYPSGPTDAESLAVAPGGAGYIVTKALLGGSTVYALPARPSTGVQTLREIGRVQFEPTGTPGGPNRIGQLTATSAAFSADGTVLAVRTYTDAYLWRVRDGDVVAALRGPPVRLALPAQPQGEGIAVDGQRLLIDSEGTNSAVYAVPLPALSPAAPSTRPAPSAQPAPSAAAPAKPDEPNHTVLIAVGSGLVALVLIGLGLRRARRDGGAG
jgi:hypothetical protein